MSQRKRKLTLVLVAGLPGTGKTTLAFKLGTLLQWPVLSKDTFKSSLMMIEIIERIAGFAAYEVLFAVAHDMLVKQQISVIIDSAALYPFILQRSAEIARVANAQLKVVRCVADVNVRSRRLKKRNTQPLPEQIVPMTPDEELQLFTHLPASTLVLSTAAPLEEYIQKVVAYVSQ